jgi:hypothetical protein
MAAGGRWPTRILPHRTDPPRARGAARLFTLCMGGPDPLLHSADAAVMLATPTHAMTGEPRHHATRSVC